jgi:ATP-dependent RNA helicase DOB1
LCFCCYFLPQTELRLVSVSLDALCALSAVRLNVPATLTSSSSAGGKDKEREREKVRTALREVRRRFGAAGPPLLDARTDMGIDSDRMDALLEQRSRLTDRLADLSARSGGSGNTIRLLFDTKVALQQRAAGLKAKASSLQTVCMRSQLRHTLRVLKRLEFVSAENVLSLKGRFACEVSASHTLLTTSMIFTGALNSLSVNQTVALCAALVNPEKGAASAAQGNGTPNT